jgi:hypothetical protein
LQWSIHHLKTSVTHLNEGSETTHHSTSISCPGMMRNQSAPVLLSVVEKKSAGVIFGKYVEWVVNCLDAFAAILTAGLWRRCGLELRPCTESGPGTTFWTFAT